MKKSRMTLVRWVEILLGLMFMVVALRAEQNLSGYWQFDEDGEITLRDSGTGGYNGTIVAGGYAQGKYGSALCFDGKKGYAIISETACLNISGPLTLEAWIYLKKLPAENEFYSLIKKGAQYCKKDLWLRVTGPSKSSPLARWVFELGDGEIIEEIGNSNVRTGQWQHIVCVFDTETLSLYADGKKAVQKSRITSIAYPVGEDNRLVFGGYPGSGEHTPDGLIDEVKIYNRALTGGEITKVGQRESASTNAGECRSALFGKTGAWEDPGIWEPKGIPGEENYVVISPGDTVVINGNANVSRITIEKDGRLIIDAAGNKKNISLVFKDVNFCGFGTKGEGILVCRGSRDYGITIGMIPSSVEAEVPVNSWKFPYSGSLVADFTTFVNGSTLNARKIDVNHCVIRRTGWGLQVKSGLSSFTGNLLDNTWGILVSKVFKDFEDVTVINSLAGESRQPSYDVTVRTVGCVEFNNSCFNSDNVLLQEGGNLISRNHGYIPGNYVVAATNLFSSAIEHKFTAADSLHLVSGTFTIDEDTKCNNLIVDFGTTLVIAADKTLKVNGGCLQEGEILQQGSLVVNKPGSLPATEDSRKIPMVTLRKIPVVSSDRTKIAVMDTQKYILDNFLPFFGLSYDILPGLQNIDSGKYSLLILGLNEVKNNPESFEEERDRLLKFVNEGGVVLAFQQNASGWFDTWLPYPLGMEEYSPPRAEIRDNNHPVFKGITDSDLREWKNTVLWNSILIKDPHWKILAGVPGRKDSAGMSECAYGKGTFILNNFAFDFDAGDILNLSSGNTIKQMKLFANILKYAIETASIPVPFELTVPLVDERELSARRKRIRCVTDKFDRMAYNLEPRLDCISFDAEYARDRDGLFNDVQALRGEIKTIGSRVETWKLADASLEQARELMKAMDELSGRTGTKIEQLATGVESGKIRNAAVLSADRSDWIQNRFHLVQTDMGATASPGSIDTLDVKYKYFKRLYTTYGWNNAFLSPYISTCVPDMTKQEYWHVLHKASVDNGIGITFTLEMPTEFSCENITRGISGSMCWNNSKAIQAIKNQIREIVEMNVSEPIPFLSVCFDEIGFRGGYCDICTGKFRAYLKNKYSPAELKNLGISDVDAVVPPMPDERDKNPVLWMEHREFVASSFENAVREVLDYARSLDKKVITYINESVALHNSCPYSASLARVSCLPDIFGIDPYRNADRIQAFYLDLVRSSAKGPTIQFTGGYCDRNNDIYERDLAIGMVHSHGVGIFAWPNIWKYRPLEPRYKDVRWYPDRWNATVSFADRAKKLENYLVNTESASPVALLYSERSHCMDFCDPLKWGTPNARYLMVQFGIYSALARTQIQMDPLFAEGLTAEKLGRYKVLFMADARSLTNEEMDIIRKWVKGGGILIATGNSTTLDRWGRKLPDYAFSDIFGLSCLRTVSGTSGSSLKVAGNRFFDDALFDEGLLCNAVYGYDVVKPASAEVIAYLTDGSPGVLVNSFGRGKCIFITAVSPGVTPSSELDRKQFSSYSRFLAMIVKTSLEKAGTALPFEAEGAGENVEVTMRSQPGKKRYILHFLHYGYTVPVKGITVKINIPEKKIENLRIFYPGIEKEITFHSAEGVISFNIDEFSVYQMIVIENAGESSRE